MIRTLFLSILLFSTAILAKIGPFTGYAFPSHLPCSKAGWTRSFQLRGAAGYNDIQLKPAKKNLNYLGWNRLLRGDTPNTLRASAPVQCTQEVTEYEVWICQTSFNKCDADEPKHIGNTLVYFEEPTYPLGIQSSYYSALTAAGEEQSGTIFEAFNKKSKVILSFLSEDIDFNDGSTNKIISDYLSQLYSYVYINQKWPDAFDINQFVALIFSKSLAQHFPIVVLLIEFITTPFGKLSNISKPLETIMPSPNFGLTPRKIAAIAAAIEIEGSDEGLIRRCVHRNDGPNCQEHIRKWGLEMQTRRNFVFRKEYTGRKEFSQKEMDNLLVVAQYIFNTISSDLNLYRSMHRDLQLTKEEENSKCEPLIAKGQFETGEIFDPQSLQNKLDPNISPTMLRYCRFRHFQELNSFISSIPTFTKEQLNKFRHSMPWIKYFDHDISVAANISQDVFVPDSDIEVILSLPQSLKLDELKTSSESDFMNAFNYLKKHEQTLHYSNMKDISNDLLRALDILYRNNSSIARDMLVNKITNLFFQLDSLLVKWYPSETMFRLFIYKRILQIITQFSEKPSWQLTYPLLQMLKIVSPKPDDNTNLWKSWALKMRDSLYSSIKISEQFIINSAELVNQIGLKNMNTFMQNFRGSLNSGVYDIVNRLLNIKTETEKFDSNLCSMPFDIIGRIKTSGTVIYPEIYVASKLPANAEIYSSAALVITKEGGLFSHAALDLMEQSIPALIGWPGTSQLRNGAWMHFSCKPGDYLKIEEKKAISKQCEQLLNKYTAEHFEGCDDETILNQVVDRMIEQSNIPKENLSNKLGEKLKKKIDARLEHLINLYEAQTLTPAQKNAFQQEFEHIAHYLPNKLLPTGSSQKYYRKGEALLFLRDKLQKNLKLNTTIKAKVPKLFIINREAIKKGFIDNDFKPEFKKYIENQISESNIEFPLIARSSSELEDSSAHRGAGIFSSLVAQDKQNIWQALRGVIESESSTRAQEYKTRIGASSEFLMSIIVQEYVPHATISGVLITSNDAKKWEMSQIQIVEGYGSGVEDSKIVSLFGVNTKTRNIEYCTNFGVPYDPHVIVTIATVGKRLEEVFGYILDIEWVYDGTNNTLWVVQAAPRKMNL